MPKLTLLQIVQDILNDMDSDEVNSINDTIESLQVAQIVKSTYFYIISGEEYWPNLRIITQLDASGTATKPTHMKMADAIQKIEWIKYNKRTSTDTKDKYGDVQYLSVKEFMDLSLSRDSTATTVDVVEDFSGVNFFVTNNKAPTYWTSIDDEYIIFDSYDSAVDITLMSSKTQVAAYKEPTWSMIDGFVPDLPSKAFSYLVEESKSAAMLKLRQVADQKAEQRSVASRRQLSLGKWRHGEGITYAGYGRK